MINALANKIIDYFILSNLISENKKSVYLYSLLILLQSAINIFATLIIGMLFGLFWENICFFIAFKMLRKFSGGLHSEKYLVCLSISIGLNTLFLCGLKYFEMNPNNLFIIFMEFFSVLIILIFAPIENSNKKISIMEFKVYKIISLSISILYILCSLVLLGKDSLYVFSIGMAMGLNSVLIIGGKMHKYKG